MKYTILDDEVVLYDLYDVVDHCISEEYHDDDEDYFEDWVNNHYDYAEIAGREYSPYQILRAFGDEYAVLDEYREEMNNDDRETAIDELRRADDGEKIYIQGYTVLCEDEDKLEATGDYDGDTIFDETVDYIEMARAYYDKCNEAAEMQSKEEKKVEDDMMSLFQHIGG